MPKQKKNTKATKAKKTTEKVGVAEDAPVEKGCNCRIHR